MSRIFAIGDIHGCGLTLEKLLLEELQITAEDEMYFLGDYIDRGPSSKKVIDLILQLQKENYHVHTLRGNHEQLFIDSEKDFENFDNWLANGGTRTLQSFGIIRFSELKEEYQSFFNGTEFYFDTPGFLFVHAGFNFDDENVFEDREAMLWIRNMKVDKNKTAGKLIVHGHTPTRLQTVRKNILSAQQTGAVNIDTGCALKNLPGYGFLSALEVATMHLFSVENVD